MTRYPNDERAQTLLANTYFGRQEYQRRHRAFRKGNRDQRQVLAAIQPDWGTPTGSSGQYGQAETAFKKYIELIPDDPNPYDSYAELLMKMGRFDESIAMYKKALAIDANFVASYIGIGNNQLFKGQPAAARETFAKIARGRAEHWREAHRALLDRRLLRSRGRHRQGRRRDRGELRALRARNRMAGRRPATST